MNRLSQVLPWIQLWVTLLARNPAIHFSLILEWNQNGTSELCCFVGKGHFIEKFLYHYRFYNNLVLLYFVCKARVVDQIWEEVFDPFSYSSLLICSLTGSHQFAQIRPRLQWSLNRLLDLANNYFTFISVRYSLSLFGFTHNKDTTK